MAGFRAAYRPFIKVFSIGAICLMLAGVYQGCSGEDGVNPKPNFIVIFTDDQGYGDVGHLVQRILPRQISIEWRTKGFDSRIFRWVPLLPTLAAHLLELIKIV